MEFNYTNNNIFGSRGKLYQENGASPQAVENAHRHYGHQGVKETVNGAQVTKAPQVPASQQPASPKPLHSFNDGFERTKPADEHMSFAKMTAFMAGSTGMA